MKEEYEVISYKQSNFYMFLVDLLYRTPHVHKDFEISLILEGDLDYIYPGGREHMSTGDFYITNPFQSHELAGVSPARILVLQLPMSYFQTCYPQIKNVAFTEGVFHCAQDTELCLLVREHLLAIANGYFSEDALKGLLCASRINLLFLDLLSRCPYRTLTEQERKKKTSRGKRMRKLVEYIDSHHEEKILLSDFAEAEGLDLYYLSHSFKEYFGISFQEYVLRARCEHAGRLLLTTDLSQLDISMECGFSDPKYMKKGFLNLFGCTPKEYRSQYHLNPKDKHQPDTITNQDIINPALCSHYLKRYR